AGINATDSCGASITCNGPLSVANQKETSVPCGVSRQCRVKIKPACATLKFHQKTRLDYSLVSFNWLWFYTVITARNMPSHHAYADSVYPAMFAAYPGTAEQAGGRKSPYKRLLPARWRYALRLQRFYPMQTGRENGPERQAFALRRYPVFRRFQR